MNPPNPITRPNASQQGPYHISGLRFVGLLILVGLQAGACAHAGPEPAGDAVEESRRRLSELLAATGDVVCAAQEAEGSRAEAALRASDLTRREHLYGRSSSRVERWRNELVRQTDPSTTRNLSGGRWSTYAMNEYDQRRGGNRIETTMSAAQFAMVWSVYLASPEDDEGRQQLLDWLTTRSMANPEDLRTYHRDFFLYLLSSPCTGQD